MYKRLKWALSLALIYAMLTSGALAEVQEGVRVAGSKLPYIIGGIAAIAFGVFVFVGMVSRGDGKTVVVLGNGLPIPMPLLALLLIGAVGIGLFQMKPSDSYVLDGVRYQLSESSAKAVGFAEGADIPRAFRLPDQVEGLPLTSVSGFSGTDIREIVLPDTLTRIGDKAFMGCAALTSINLPEGVTEIGDSAFRDCAALTSVELPEKLKKLGTSAFEGCGALKTAAFPTDTDPLSDIGARCFADCAALESVYLNAKAVPDGAFRNCVSLVAADLRSSEQVGKSAFEGCAALRCVSAAYASDIGDRAFANCPELMAVGVGYRARKLPKNIFEGSAGAVLYNSGTDETQKKAAKLGLPTSSDRFFGCEYLSDGTLRLTGWSWGEPEGTFTVPATWCGLPVSAASLYKSTGQANSVYEYDHEEIVVEEGVRRLEDKCFHNWENPLRRLYLPDSLEEIGKDIVTGRSNKKLTVYTSNPVAIEYANRYNWEVEGAGSK